VGVPSRDLDGRRPGLRLEVQAESLEDARLLIEAEYGEGHIISVWNEEDANRRTEAATHGIAADGARHAEDASPSPGSFSSVLLPEVEVRANGKNGRASRGGDPWIPICRQPAMAGRRRTQRQRPLRVFARRRRSRSEPGGRATGQSTPN
jgi:hypothetical protein